MELGRRFWAAIRAFRNPALRQPRLIPPPEPTRIVVDRLMEGRTALVTGAGGLIGRSIALELLGQGANVHCTDIDPGRLESLAAEMARFPGTARVHRADITRPEDGEAVLSAIREEGRTVDLLVNNVGIVADDFRESFATNVIGPMSLTDRVARLMIDAKVEGSVVFLSSIHQETLFTRTRAYAATKASVRMLVKQLAVELAPHRIRVNSIAPGDVRGAVERFPYTPLEGSSIPPQYIARSVVYLASDYYSRYTTGATVTIDGGLSLFNYQCAMDAGLYG
jgi:NAD(P)-dependent dehydrogenase (short-subunit alcohol dehydrogenase family)